MHIFARKNQVDIVIIVLQSHWERNSKEKWEIVYVVKMKMTLLEERHLHQHSSVQKMQVAEYQPVHYNPVSYVLIGIKFFQPM